MKKKHKRRRNTYTFPLRMDAVVFVVILIYLVICTISYINKPRISVYEVAEKNLSDDYACTGIILRDETVVSAEKEGYLNYYYSEGAKIAKNSIVCTVDETGDMYDLLQKSNKNAKLSKSERKVLWDQIRDFRKKYSKDKYLYVSDFVYGIENTVLELANSSMAQNISTVLSENLNNTGYKNITNKESGIITYFVDGYENITEEDITQDSFRVADYTKQQLRSMNKVNKGDPVYKMVTKEDWSIVISLTEEVYNELYNREQEKKQDNGQAYVKLNLVKEKLVLSLPYYTFTKDDGYYAKIDLNDYLIHYVTERFIEVELSMDTVEGLKIPVSSILKKEFYMVPSEYFTEGGDSGNSGLIKEVYEKTGEVSYTFVEASSYYETEDGIAYIDKELFSPGEWIRNEKNQERYQIATTGELSGVYNVNYGYCLFRRIEILYENPEYCIVKSGLYNSVSVYDHIVVDAETVTENDLINKYKSE